MGTEGGGERAGSGQDLAPGIVGVPDNHSTGGIEERNHIALCVGHIVVGRAVVDHRHRCALGTVGKVQNIGANRHAAQTTSVVNILIGLGGCSGADFPLGTHAVGIVFHVPGQTVSGHGRQFPAMLPGKGPSGAVVEAERIALLLYSIQNICAIMVFPKYFFSVLSVFHNAKGPPGENPRIL